MLWSEDASYHLEPFEKEADLESAIREVSPALFGPDRIYLEVKKLIGAKGGTRNIPDAYLVDLSSPKKPLLWVVENELASHDPLRHIAVQILQMSLSFEATPPKVKGIVKDALEKDTKGWQRCEQYAKINGFQNIDFLLEEMIHRNAFRALVVIDELDADLGTLLASRFRFGVEVLTINRYRSEGGERIYDFEPFLSDVDAAPAAVGAGVLLGGVVDPSDLDTVVVPAQKEGFNETFLGERRWYKVRLHSSMIPQIKHIAAYQIAPLSAITYVAPVKSIEPWQDSGKYVLNFSEPARKLPHQIKLVQKGTVKAPRSPRYTSYERLMNAKTMEEVF